MVKKEVELCDNCTKKIATKTCCVCKKHLCTPCTYHYKLDGDGDRFELETCAALSVEAIPVSICKNCYQAIQAFYLDCNYDCDNNCDKCQKALDRQKLNSEVAKELLTILRNKGLTLLL